MELYFAVISNSITDILISASVTIVLGVISSILYSYLIRKFNKLDKSTLNEYNSFIFYFGIASFILSIVAIVGFICSVINLWLSGKRLSSAKSNAYKISFFFSIIGLSLSSINGAFGSFYFFNKDNVETELMFNRDANDRPLFVVMNNALTPLELRYSSNSWSHWTDAKFNDTLQFTVYYHNIGNRDSKEVRIRFSYDQYKSILLCGLALNENQSNNIYLGYCGINVKEDTTYTPLRLDIVGGSWFPDQKTSPAILPYNQDATYMYTLNGLNIGQIQKGWEHQGSYVFSVIVHHAL